MSALTLGPRMRARRKELGWTLDELATRTRLTKGFLSDLERDKRRPGADSLLAIARELNVSLDALARGTRFEAVAVASADFPPSLVQFADQADIPFRHALVLYRLQQVIMAHRTPPRRIDLNRVDWERFNEAVKEFL